MYTAYPGSLALSVLLKPAQNYRVRVFLASTVYYKSKTKMKANQEYGFDTKLTANAMVKALAFCTRH